MVVMPSGCYLSYLILSRYPLPRFSPRVSQACHVAGLSPRLGTEYCAHDSEIYTATEKVRR